MIINFNYKAFKENKKQNELKDDNIITKKKTVIPVLPNIEPQKMNSESLLDILQSQQEKINKNFENKFFRCKEKRKFHIFI